MKRRTSLTNVEIAGTIRFLCFVAIAANLGGSTVFALDPLGPPRATIEHSQSSLGTGFSRGETVSAFILDPFQPSLGAAEQYKFSVGADFSFSKMDLELTNGKWVETDPETELTSGNFRDITLKDFERIKLYSTVGYSFAENWEAFVRLGAAKAEFGDSIWQAAGENFDSNIELAIGGGVRGTLFDIPEYDLQIGGVIQANWSNFDGKLDAPSWPAPDSVEISLLEAQIAIGATYAWTDCVSIYGGPFVHYIQGDVEDIFANYEYSWDIEGKTTYGGYLGAVMDLGVWMDLAQDCFFNIEYQHTADASALGAGLMLRF